MKLSDAIMLGITMYELKPAAWFCKDGGCLCGIALLAVNEEAPINLASAPILWEWPWLDKMFSVPPLCVGPVTNALGDPYGWVSYRVGGSERALAIISRMASQVKRGDITLEQAVDWIRSVEPQEEPVTQTEEVSRDQLIWHAAD